MVRISLLPIFRNSFYLKFYLCCVFLFSQSIFPVLFLFLLFFSLAQNFTITYVFAVCFSGHDTSEYPKEAHEKRRNQNQ